MACSKLEEIGKQYRAENLPKNNYTEGGAYGPNHPNATQEQGGADDPQNIRGKGTGQPFDTENGGSAQDIAARQSLYSNTYNPDKRYTCEVSEGF